jgi:hypothetical protein
MFAPAISFDQHRVAMGLLLYNALLIVFVILTMSSITNQAFEKSTTTKPAAMAFASSVPLEKDRDGLGGKAKGELPRLPPPYPDSKLRSIKLGETIQFEEMGPVIINVDGTTRRIENWDQLTDSERDVSWRRISKRNEERRKILLQKQQEEEKAAGKEEL